MFKVVITTFDEWDYRRFMDAIESHPFEDVTIISREPAGEKMLYSVKFDGTKTRNTDAHAYFVKRDLIAHVEPVA